MFELDGESYLISDLDQKAQHLCYQTMAARQQRLHYQRTADSIDSKQMKEWYQNTANLCSDAVEFRESCLRVVLKDVKPSH
jgi:hypothetical protein